MCLAVPAVVVDILENDEIIVEEMGVEQRVSSLLTPEVRKGDHVLVHAGFSLVVLDRKWAEESLDLWKGLLFPVSEGR